MIKNIIPWAFALLMLFGLFQDFFGGKEGRNTEVPYSTFLDWVENGEVRAVSIEPDLIVGEKNNGEKFLTYTTADPRLIDDLRISRVQISATRPDEPSILLRLFVSSFPILLLIGVWLFFMRQMQGGGQGGGPGGAFSFGKSRARKLEPENHNITFDNVAGVDEAKEEVAELVEFLSEPHKFGKLGGRVPCGVLLTGNPGTGKTLLAKAIAGEANVPFFSISGSDFVEMFVGVGASRVRDLFAQAKKTQPCIIFIDEIDAVGRQRGAGHGGGNDEREQTLNQLLVEMDGFEDGEGVIVIAATNRPDVLDSALLRPGRFDRQVYVPLPDIRGREEILNVHVKKVPLDKNTDLKIIARGTPGFSGADLENLVNEAALFATRSNKRKVTMEDFEKAKDKVLMGAERRSMIMSDFERKNTAYHESGHAVVAKVLALHADPVHKVTIIPRGRALGVTMQLPLEDRYSHSKEYLLTRIAVLMGGRIAEEIFMNQMTTGASNDFEVATQLAKNMVTKWGMSSKLGPRVYGEEQQESFFRSPSESISPATAELIENETSRVINEQYKRARDIIEKEKEKIEVMANSLLDWETLDAGQIDEIMSGEQPSETTANTKTSERKKTGTPIKKKTMHKKPRVPKQST